MIRDAKCIPNWTYMLFLELKIYCIIVEFEMWQPQHFSLSKEAAQSA